MAPTLALLHRVVHARIGHLDANRERNKTASTVSRAVESWIEPRKARRVGEGKDSRAC